MAHVDILYYNDGLNYVYTIIIIIISFIKLQYNLIWLLSEFVRIFLGGGGNSSSSLLNNIFLKNGNFFQQNHNFKISKSQNIHDTFELAFSIHSIIYFQNILNIIFAYYPFDLLTLTFLSRFLTWISIQWKRIFSS